MPSAKTSGLPCRLAGFASLRAAAYLEVGDGLAGVMTAVERLEDESGGTPRPDPIGTVGAAGEVVIAPSKGRAKLRPLVALWPYVNRYRGRAILALIALTIAALTTLLVPLAV